MSETTWYDIRGTATAYIAEDGKTVYLWKGKAVAYLVDDKVYSWRGRHIGFFLDGIVYDDRGRRIGYTAATSPVEVSAEPAKAKPSKPTPKSPRAGAQARPPLLAGQSAVALGAFLQS